MIKMMMIINNEDNNCILTVYARIVYVLVWGGSIFMVYLRLCVCVNEF